MKLLCTSAAKPPFTNRQHLVAPHLIHHINCCQQQKRDQHACQSGKHMRRMAFLLGLIRHIPLEGPLYDDVRFEPLTGERDGKYFLVALDSHHELIKWTLYTERYGYDAPEFCCGNVREMTAYINAMAPELAQGIQPRFVLEKAAVGEYVRQHEGKAAYSIRREGDHLFAYQSSRDWKYRTVAVSDSPENVPQGFPAERAEQHGMLYVFPSKAPALDRADYVVRRAQRRKEQTR